MKAVDTTIALFALAALSPAAAFVPSAASRAAIGRTRALPQKSQTTCSPAHKSSAVFHSGKGASALFGTGPSYTDVVSETEGGEEGDEEGGKKKKKKGKKSGGDKEKVKLEAEVTFFEGGPDPSEVVAPALSILTVIGIVPFSAALARQAWVKYTLTSRRIKIVSGWNGKDTTEVVYPDIVDMVYVWRFFGRCGDLVLTLRDGSKLEIRSLPDFERNYNYIRERTSASCQAKSAALKPQN
ncbi:unnamed protein product [Ectocarpus sp. CCAP 1310/34]|nr:unnamed protein product [Ectocarpus sp. CCAP 1310/34]